MVKISAFFRMLKRNVQANVDYSAHGVGGDTDIVSCRNENSEPWAVALIVLRKNAIFPSGGCYRAVERFVPEGGIDVIKEDDRVSGKGDAG